jgi:MFS family permease
MREPPPGRSGSGANWGRGRPPNGNDPDRTIVGAPYNGGPMTPGPNPNQTVYRGGPMAPGNNPYGPPQRGGTMPGRDGDRTIVGRPGSMTPSRPNPGATMAGRPGPGASIAGPLAPDGTARSRAISMTSLPVAPREHLLSGNLRRLWLSEIAARAGDVILGTGTVIWYLQLTHQFVPVALLVLAFALPPALLAPVAGALAARRDPRRLLLLLGVLRIALALVFVAMHFHTIPQLILALAFGLSLVGTVRAALRRAAVARGVPVRARGVLASGDQVAATILAVVGPALTTFLFVINGERIFTIAVGAALCYVIAITGESQAEPLPDKILFQRPAGDDPRVANVWEGDEDAEEDSAVLAAEAQAQVWELAAPPTPRAAIADVRDGLGIAGTATHAQAALWGLALLAAAGGILAVGEPWYLWDHLGQVPFMLGFLFMAAGFGAAIASAVVVAARTWGRFFLVVGLLASGAGLVALARMTDLPHALGAIAVISAANVFAIRGGQMVLLRHFVPVAQRAVAAASAAVTALLALFGMILGCMMIEGVARVAPVGLTNALGATGAAVVLGGVTVAVLVLLPNRDLGAQAIPALVATPSQDEWDDTADDDFDDAEDDPSRRYPAYGFADDSDRYSAYSAQYPAYSDEYEAPSRRGRYDNDEDDTPPRRSPRR